MTSLRYGLKLSQNATSCVLQSGVPAGPMMGVA